MARWARAGIVPRLWRHTVTSKTLTACKRDRPDVARRRAQGRQDQGRIDPTRLVFIDETWARPDRTRTQGWAPRGARRIAKVPHARWQTTTCLAALRPDRIDRPCRFDGPIKRALPMSNKPSFQRSSPATWASSTIWPHTRASPGARPSKTPARTAEAIWDPIRKLLKSGTPKQGANYIENAQYASN